MSSFSLQDNAELQSFEQNYGDNAETERDCSRARCLSRGSRHGTRNAQAVTALPILLTPMLLPHAAIGEVRGVHRLRQRVPRRSSDAGTAARGLELPLRTGMVAVIVLVLAAAMYPVIHSRRLETVEVLRAS